MGHLPTYQLFKKPFFMKGSEATKSNVASAKEDAKLQKVKPDSAKQGRISEANFTHLFMET